MAVVDQKERYRRHAALCYDIAAGMTGERATSMLLLGDTYAALAVHPDRLPPDAPAPGRGSVKPRCKVCRGEMQLAHLLSRTNLPSIRAFWCDQCGETLTWRGDSREPASQVSVRASRWITRYIAVSFRRGGRDFSPGPAVECPDAELAIRRAELMTRQHEIAGAVAFSRRWNSRSGEFDVALILEIFGDIPEGFNIA